MTNMQQLIQGFAQGQTVTGYFNRRSGLILHKPSSGESLIYRRGYSDMEVTE